MKKNSTVYWRIMRITLIQAAFAMAFVGVTLAHDDFGQGLLDTEVSAEFESQSLKNVLLSLEKQTSVKFAYSGSIVNLEEKISMKADRKKLSEILHELLSPRHIGYEEKNDYILLTPVYLITGKITDSKTGTGLPGVSILVKGTASGTTTDAEGKFSVNADGGDNLIVSFIGYKTFELAINNQTALDIKLEEDIAMLGEVVVSGYTTQSKAEFTGSSSSVKVDNLNRPVPNFVQSLAGQAAGVSVVSSGGALNSAPVFRIRGTNSINLSSYPLIIIDGVTSFTGDVGNSAENNPLSALNPNDIESMDILKDASATAIYGSRAANGVVVITTKKGRPGAAKVTYDGWVGINTRPSRIPKVLGAQDYVMIKNEAMVNMGLAPGYALQEKPDGSGIVDTDWYDMMYQTGVSQNHNVNVSGASDATSYYVSLGYTDQEGFMVKNTFERATARVNLTHKLTKKLTIGTNFSYSNSLNSNLTSGGSFALNNLAREAMVLPPNLDPLNPDGTYNIVGNSIGYGANTILTGYYNPLPQIQHDKFTSQSTSMIGLVFAELELLKGLRLKTNYSLNDLGTVNSSFSNPYQAGGFSSNGSATKGNNSNKRTNWTNTLTYVTTIASKHNITALVGYENIYTANESYSVTRQNLNDRFFEDFAGSWATVSGSNGAFTENAFRSLFSNVTYDYKKKYLLNASFRRDGFSGLSEGNKYGNFGGGSVGWNVSEEQFFQNSPVSTVISGLKLRASYGQVGNVNIGNYPALDLYAVGTYAGIATTLAPSQTGNRNLQWETSKKTDLGVNLSFLNNRITLDVDYYKNNIDGMVLDALQAPSKGIPGNSITTNVGSMYNQGFEFDIDYKAINRGSLKWTIGFNLSNNKNKVTGLANNNSDIWSSGLGVSNITRVGESIASVYVVETPGVNPANGLRTYTNRNDQVVQYNPAASGSLQWTYLDGTTAPAMDAYGDGRVVGVSTPKVYGGLNNTISYKDFDLGVNFTYSLGNKMYNGTRATNLDNRFFNNTYDILDRWTTPGQVTDMPKLHYNDQYASGSVLMHSANVENGGYIKLRNVSVGYRVPSMLYSKSGINSIRVYASATNFILWTKYSGADPEISSNGDSNTASGRDQNTMPAGKAFTFGLNLGF